MSNQHVPPLNSKNPLKLLDYAFAQGRRLGGLHPYVYRTATRAIKLLADTPQAMAALVPPTPDLENPLASLETLLGSPAAQWEHAIREVRAGGSNAPLVAMARHALAQPGFLPVPRGRPRFGYDEMMEWIQQVAKGDEAAFATLLAELSPAELHTAYYGDHGTLLHRTALFGCPRALEMLADAGADFSCREESGLTPLDGLLRTNVGMDNVKWFIGKGIQPTVSLYDRAASTLHDAWFASHEYANAPRSSSGNSERQWQAEQFDQNMDSLRQWHSFGVSMDTPFFTSAMSQCGTGCRSLRQLWEKFSFPPEALTPGAPSRARMAQLIDELSINAAPSHVPLRPRP